MPKESHHKPEDRYSIATKGATALAVGLGLSGATQADAGNIVYTDLDPDVMIQNSIYDLNVDSGDDSVVDFQIFQFEDIGGDLLFAGILGEDENAVAISGYTKIPVDPYFIPNAAALSYGTQVAPQKFFSYPKFPVVIGADFGYQIKGNWPGMDAYLGLRFDRNGSTHYGWAHLSVPADVSKVTLFGYAYCDQPNASIAAGQTEGTCSVIPEPSSLLLLAAGAAGVLAYRRKMRSQQKPS